MFQVYLFNYSKQEIKYILWVMVDGKTFSSTKTKTTFLFYLYIIINFDYIIYYVI